MQIALIRITFATIILYLMGSASYSRDRALIVGVNEYSNITRNGKHGIVDLKGAVPDAKSFAKALVDIFKFDPQDVKLLTDRDATTAAILEGFEHFLIAGSKPGDRVIFFFSGHGATASVSEGNSTRLTSTIVPSDTKGDLGNSDPFTGMIEGRTIGHYIARLKDRRVTVFADSCHSGSVTRGGLDQGDPNLLVRTLTPRMPIGMKSEDFTQDFQRDLKTENDFLEKAAISSIPTGHLAVWSAAALDQVTFDLPDGTGGIFTQSFLKGIQNPKIATMDDALAPGKLITFIRREAEVFCEAHHGMCQKLTPDLQPSSAYRNLTLISEDVQSNTSPANGSQAAADAIDLLSHKNDFGLDVDILPNPKVKLNGIVKFRILAEESGTLVVLDSGPDGKLRQIFPNPYGDAQNKTGIIRANAATTIPDASYGFNFRATDPGRGQLLVLVADKKLDLTSIINKSLDSKPIADPRGIIVELAETVQTPMVSPDLSVPNGSYKWAFKAIPYEVER